ncbi:hypothetical protein ACFPM0_14130 [Pseudonocardia sulfidoxydans]
MVPVPGRLLRHGRSPFTLVSLTSPSPARGCQVVARRVTAWPAAS